MIIQNTLLAIVMLTLTACVGSRDVDYVGQASDNTSKTSAMLVEKYISQHETSQLNTDKPMVLTQLVDIPELNAYIDAALKHNPDLQQSVAALKILYAQRGVTNADRLPSLDMSFSGQNEQDSGKTYTSDVSVSWELDLWGRLRDTTRATDKDIANSQASLQETRDVLIAKIMRSWLEISLYQQLVDIETRRLGVLENNEAMVLRRYQTGLGTLEDLDDARTNTETTRSTVAEYKETLEQSKRDLILLTGQWSGEDLNIHVPGKFPEVLNPVNQLQKQTLERRPDVRAALYNIEAESLRTDAAYKALLPSISLSGSITSAAVSPSDALFHSSLWSLLGQISAPLFQGGKLRSEVDMAQYTTEQSFWAYQSTLLTAVNEVENAVGQERALAKQQEHLQNALKSAKRSSDNYKEKYRQGLVDILDLLTIQQQTYDTEAKLVNAIYDRLVNRIDLGLALGLGYKA